jgi:hypothetical protein
VKTAEKKITKKTKSAKKAAKPKFLQKTFKMEGLSEAYPEGVSVEDVVRVLLKEANGNENSTEYAAAFVIYNLALQVYELEKFALSICDAVKSAADYAINAKIKVGMEDDEE